MNETTGRDRLSEVIVALPYDRTTTLAELVDGWAKHVERLRAEQDRSFDDPDVWGAHDYIAALYLRDFIIAGLDQSPADVRSSALGLVRSADEAFRSFTEPDLRGVVSRFSGEPHPDEIWWWKRLPISGPVREELLRPEQSNNHAQEQ